MQIFFEKYHQYISSNDMLVVAVSGGVDSMVLLYLILSLHDPSRIVVAHFDHSLRGVESDGDREFIAEFCNIKNIRFISEKMDIQEIATTEKMSIEMAARKYRYEFLHRICDETQARYILTAHHLDDRIETAVFHLIRGTKLGGIHALQEMGHDGILRLFLDMPKSSILTYAQDQGIAYREDSTNHDILYTRNKIRHDILPEFASINPEYRTNIREFIDYTRELKGWIDRSIERFFNQYPSREFSLSHFLAEPLFFQKECLRYLYENANHGTVGLSEGGVLELIRFLSEASNSYGIKEIKKLRLERRGDRVSY